MKAKQLLELRKAIKKADRVSHPSLESIITSEKLNFDKMHGKCASLLIRKGIARNVNEPINDSEILQGLDLSIILTAETILNHYGFNISIEKKQRRNHVR